MSKSQQLIDRVSAMYEPASEIEEAAAQRATVFRGGQRVQKLDCPPGYILKGGMCSRETPQQIMTRRKAAKKAAKTLGVQGRRKAMAKRMKSDARREQAGLKV